MHIILEPLSSNFHFLGALSTGADQNASGHNWIATNQSNTMSSWMLTKMSQRGSSLSVSHRIKPAPCSMCCDWPGPSHSRGTLVWMGGWPNQALTSAQLFCGWIWLKKNRFFMESFLGTPICFKQILRNEHPIFGLSHVKEGTDLTLKKEHSQPHQTSRKFHMAQTLSRFWKLQCTSEHFT